MKPRKLRSMVSKERIKVNEFSLFEFRKNELSLFRKCATWWGIIDRSIVLLKSRNKRVKRYWCYRILLICLLRSDGMHHSCQRYRSSQNLMLKSRPKTNLTRKATDWTLVITRYFVYFFRFVFQLLLLLPALLTSYVTPRFWLHKICY